MKLLMLAFILEIGFLPAYSQNQESVSSEDKLRYRTEQRDYWVLQKQVTDAGLRLQQDHDKIAKKLRCDEFKDDFTCVENRSPLQSNGGGQMPGGGQ